MQMTLPQPCAHAPRSWLIKGGTVVTLERESVVPDGDVLIEGGVIVAVGKSLPDANAEVIDARGMIVLPGLIDAHRLLRRT
ncbi:hypothetical protein [Burkholderia ubonensis]|uniref:hypothetical protein n=1 Tax=Burkholderia ubonensis TaxID=101571 RepID=UPI000B1B8A5E|nr:hypothetical protein [Burkholderia ubonensis]